MTPAGEPWCLLCGQTKCTCNAKDKIWDVITRIGESIPKECKWDKRKTGPVPGNDWIDKMNPVYFTECKRVFCCECNTLEEWDFHYCPWCGGKIIF